MDDSDDEFLYGPSSPKSLAPADAKPDTDVVPGVTTPADLKDTLSSPAADTEPAPTSPTATNVVAAEEETEEDKDSESDLEIITELPSGEAVTEGAPANQGGTDGKKASDATVAEIAVATSAPNAVHDSTSAVAAPAGSNQRGRLIIDEIGQYNGEDILDFNTDDAEDKPWRKPGADLTDYFNYGFTELSWKLYCQRQKQLREDQQLKMRFNGMPGPDGMLDGFPMGMPGMMPPGMMGMGRPPMVGGGMMPPFMPMGMNGGQSFMYPPHDLDIPSDGLDDQFSNGPDQDDQDDDRSHHPDDRDDGDDGGREPHTRPNSHAGQPPHPRFGPGGGNPFQHQGKTNNRFGPGPPPMGNFPGGMPPYGMGNNFRPPNPYFGRPPGMPPHMSGGNFPNPNFRPPHGMPQSGPPGGNNNRPHGTRFDGPGNQGPHPNRQQSPPRGGGGPRRPNDIPHRPDDMDPPFDGSRHDEPGRGGSKGRSSRRSPARNLSRDSSASSRRLPTDTRSRRSERSLSPDKHHDQRRSRHDGSHGHRSGRRSDHGNRPPSPDDGHRHGSSGRSSRYRSRERSSRHRSKTPPRTISIRSSSRREH
ncbi:cleavage polyadenylation factor subunit fip1 [Tieghemiomyces parasiticus]|uniref:Cleavage polyadenylation factor subunit fip1 n=1 Tax=Tieghemiomyces parasiticus TaxID=78921 RepID=A0A9W7ZW90_9FUNG|nr:cleavage polyadenylation factor subunit fip1 [Tieghemiomyces parasiticus]